MEGVHPLEDLAPRDVVAATISRRMAEAPGGVGDHVFLDATHLGEGFDERFPSITQSCLAVGVDPARDRIPVAPAAHYVCGGVRPISVGHRDAGALRDRRSRLDRRARCEPSGIEQPHRGRRRRYPRGDGDRAALPVAVDVGSDAGRSYDAPLRNPAQRVELRSVMSNQVGVLRTPLGLDSAIRQLPALAASSSVGVAGLRAAWEATNILTVAAAVAKSALTRTESRGCHRRDDHPAPRDAWLIHLDVRLTIDGGLAVTGIPHV